MTRSSQIHMGDACDMHDASTCPNTSRASPHTLGQLPRCRCVGALGHCGLNAPTTHAPTTRAQQPPNTALEARRTVVLVWTSFRRGVRWLLGVRAVGGDQAYHEQRPTPPPTRRHNEIWVLRKAKGKGGGGGGDSGAKPRGLWPDIHPRGHEEKGQAAPQAQQAKQAQQAQQARRPVLLRALPELLRGAFQRAVV